MAAHQQCSVRRHRGHLGPRGSRACAVFPAACCRDCSCLCSQHHLGAQPASHLCRQCRPLSLHIHRLGSQACFRQRHHPNGHDPGGGHDQYGPDPYGHHPTSLRSFLTGSTRLQRWKTGSCSPSPGPNLYSGPVSSRRHHTGHLGHTGQHQLSHCCPQCLWHSHSKLRGKHAPDLPEAHSPGHPRGEHRPQHSEQPCSWGHPCPHLNSHARSCPQAQRPPF